MLLPGREMRAAVLLPAILGGFGTLRPLLAIADGLYAVARDPQLHQEVLGRGGSPVTKRKIVLGRTALVAMAFHHDAEVRILRKDLFQESRVVRQSIAGIGTDIAFVEIKE